MSDGVMLHCTEHPRGGFWLRLRNWLRRGPRKGSIETVELELPEGPPSMLYIPPPHTAEEARRILESVVDAAEKG